MDLTVHSSYDK